MAITLIPQWESSRYEEKYIQSISASNNVSSKYISSDLYVLSWHRWHGAIHAPDQIIKLSGCFRARAVHFGENIS